MLPSGVFSPVVIVSAALALSACASEPDRYAQYYAQQQQYYGQGGPYVAAQPYAVAQRPGAYQQYAAYGEPPYQLDSGDRVRITVYGQEGLNNSYVVDPSGLITLPLAGPIQARGLSKDQLAGAITAKLKQGYIREPHVAVEIETYRPFFILGEVNAPGQYPYVANLTVETAVAIAGGYSPRASKGRATISRMVNGQNYRTPAPAGTPLRPGDTIQIEERWF